MTRCALVLLLGMLAVQAAAIEPRGKPMLRLAIGPQPISWEVGLLSVSSAAFDKSEIITPFEVAIAQNLEMDSGLSEASLLIALSSQASDANPVNHAEAAWYFPVEDVPIAMCIESFDAEGHIEVMPAYGPPHDSESQSSGMSLTAR